MASLIIPAHNEAGQIETLLEQLRSEVTPNDRVFVIANGCTDDTAQRAGAFDFVTVIEQATPSKIVALNTGDEAARDNFPRLYLDADIAMQMGSVRALIEALNVPEPRVVAPHVSIDVSFSSFLVRAYYYVVSRHPWIVKHASTHLAGRRIYGANEAARKRFGLFPTVTNDDGFFDQCYSATERKIVDNTMVFTLARRTSDEEVGRLVRVRRGNLELEAWFTASGQPRPDRESPIELKGSRLGRIVRMMATSGFVKRPAALAPAYILGWLIMKRRVNAATQLLDQRGGAIEWAGK